ncbi:MAG: PAS domain S-box protein [Nitrospiraceae bacterium]|nr:PAS domain S-box protein [Nitrospiraceae bacterium]
MSAGNPDSPERRDYIDGRLLRLVYYWANVVYVIGAFLFLVFAVVDYFMSPANFRFFLLLRCLVAAALLFICFLHRVINGKRIKKGALYFLIMTAIILEAGVMEITILRLGGAASPYYAGLILVVMSVLGLLPLDFPFAMISAATVYLIYIVPLVVRGGLDKNLPLFINNNTLLISAIMLGLVWRFCNQRRIVEVLGLQYDLDVEKRRLETYSTGLERLVEERTREMNKSGLMLRSLFRGAQDGILITDKSGNILKVNQALCDIYGFSRDSLAGANIALLETHDNDALFRQRMERVLKGETLLYETRHYRKDGGMVSLEISSKVIEVEGEKLIQSFCRDVTEKKKMQAQLVHSQKMESIGQLAGGISHDFNNILTSILGFSELILFNKDLDDSVAAKVRAIEKVSRQAVHMVSKLLSFARKDHFEPVRFGIDRAVDDALEMASGLIPAKITLSRQRGAPHAFVEGDPGMMGQVLMNLIINARDAMPDGGTLAVKTSVVELGPSNLDIGVDVARGSYANIHVGDTGIGIPENDIPHIFEPFFTTKGKGKGTGLGLAMVYGIVKEHGGYITVESKPGAGSVFNVYVPLCAEQSGPAKSAGPEVPGGETILAIDRESTVLEFMKETLSGRGFNVIAVRDPVRGLELYRSNPGGINLVITDMVMPATDGGPGLISDIKTINPRARVIAMAGNNNHGEAGGGYTILEKPVTPGRLLAAVRKVLDPPV